MAHNPEKTEVEKKLVLVRFERNGLPRYIVAWLLEMEDPRGTDAGSLHKGINSIYSADGRLPFKDYEAKLICCTAD